MMKKIIPEIVKKHNVKNIYFNRETTSEELLLLKKIRDNIKDINIDINYKSFWGNNMYSLNDLPYKINKLPNTFTQFKKVIENYEPQYIDEIEDKYFSNSILINDDIDIIKKKLEPLVNLKSPLLGGETNAWKRLNYYFYQTKLLSNYKNTRNGLLGMDYSSKLSPYLAFGNISAKSIYYEIINYENIIESNKSTYWLYFELLWRDYLGFTVLNLVIIFLN